MTTPQQSTGLTTEEMIEHESNSDIKKVLQKRSNLYEVINISCELIAFLASKVDTTTFDQASHDQMKLLFTNYRIAHFKADPTLRDFLSTKIDKKYT